MTENITAGYFQSAINQVRYPVYVSYVAIGAPTLFTNLSILIIIVSDKALLAKSSFIFGLAMANVCNGLHTFGYGVYRLPLLVTNTIDDPGNVWGCMASFLPTLAILELILPPSMQFVIGLERLIAVVTFKWYRTHWSPRKSWYVVSAVFILNLIIWVIPLWYRVITVEFQVTKECSSLVLAGEKLIICLYQIGLLINLVGVTCVFLAVMIGYCRSRKLSARGDLTDIAQFRTQLGLSKMMLLIALFDFSFVILPSLVMGVISALNMPPNLVLAVYGNVINCSNSISNIFIYLAKNGKFRRVAIAKVKLAWSKYWCCFRWTAKVSAIPISNRQVG